MVFFWYIYLCCMHMNFGRDRSYHHTIKNTLQAYMWIFNFNLFIWKQRKCDTFCSKHFYSIILSIFLYIIYMPIIGKKSISNYFNCIAEQKTHIGYHVTICNVPTTSIFTSNLKMYIKYNTFKTFNLLYSCKWNNIHLKNKIQNFFLFARKKK